MREKLLSICQLVIVEVHVARFEANVKCQTGNKLNEAIDGASNVTTQRHLCGTHFLFMLRIYFCSYLITLML